MHSKKLLFRIGLVALIVRVLYLIQHAGSPFFGRALLDQHYYDLCARQLAGEGGGIIDGFRPLLYPLFASLFYRIDPDSGLFLTTLVQHGLGIIMAIMIAWLASRFFNSIKAGAVAGLLFALSAPPLYFEGELLITTLFSFLLLVLWMVVYLALKCSDQGRRDARDTSSPAVSTVSDTQTAGKDACSTAPRTAAVSAAKAAALWLTAGLILGLAAQARPNALPLLLFFPLISLFRFFRTTKRRSKDTPPYQPDAHEVGTSVPTRPLGGAGIPRTPTTFLPLLAIVSVLVVQISFSALNAQYSGEFSLTTQAGGINFYLGNGERADGMIPRQSKHVVYDGEYRDPIQLMAEQDYRTATGETGKIDQRKVSSYWKEKTFKEIKQKPSRWFGLMFKKSWLMIWNHEVPNNRSFAFTAKEETSLLRWLPVRWWLLLGLFPFGIAALIKRREKELLLWACSFMVIFSGTVILFFVNSRFRIPLWPGMTILGGGGAMYLWENLKCRRVALIPAISGAALILLSTINWFRIPPDPIEHDLSMRAGIYLENGQLDNALTDISRCLNIAPNNPRYHFVKGNILLAGQRNIEAAGAYIQAIALNSEDPMFHNNLGIAFENSADFEKAEIAYQNALRLNPQHFAAHTNLMLLKLRIGETETAQSLLTPLLNQSPDNPTLLCARAMLEYKTSGDPKALDIAKQLNPELAEQLVGTIYP
ncbi:MAG: tetratricopeptide repeat protein [Pontiellaceae bacterium]|nr:tetratricopeptide repeat protein [Pontiellaceae bacterium]